MGFGGGTGYLLKERNFEMERYDLKMKRECVRNLMLGVSLTASILCLSHAVYHKYDKMKKHESPASASMPVYDSGLEQRVTVR